MTPQEFIEKWRQVDLKERTASQSHFIDLCRLLGIDDPITADPKGDWFTFEKGASKTSGGEGWADVWRKGCFAWEYKGKKANLNRAFDQLLQYSIALENPPLLIVSDMDVIRIHTNWTNTVQKVHTLALADLTDAANRDLLRDVFQNPEKFKPAKTRQLLTEEAAQSFATLAQRLRDRGHDAQEVAHFVNRLVFCMFAEDVDLLPNKMFQRMLEHCRQNPGDFKSHAQTLFAAMRAGGMVGFERVDWFNGGLFDSDNALPMEKADVADLLTAAKLDWSDIDPSILGTLFERGLDPSKRSQLGAHYTDRDKIMQIVNPVIVEPLLAEWAEVRNQIEGLIDKAPKQTKAKLLRGKELAARTKALKEAEALHQKFLDRLLAFRVLDPACGSGNFLYISLLELKNIEHRVNLEAEAIGLPRGFPRIGPEAVLGIELNPYAAELARVSVWIGEIQWMRRNGFQAAKNPILRALDTIECRDAVLNDDGTQAEWPKADAVVGNPPFLGDRKMIAELGEEYTFALRNAYEERVPGGSDLVCYWFAKAWGQIENEQLEKAGLVATNSIRGGANRTVVKNIVRNGQITSAWSDEAWTVEGADVRVSLMCFARSASGTVLLNGKTVDVIHSDLTSNSLNFDLTDAKSLLTNSGICFIGTQKNGPFDISGEVARAYLLSPLNPNGRPNSDVVFPWSNGSAITQRDPDKWIIDFGATMTQEEASLYEGPYERVVRDVKPTREKLRRDWHRIKWWLHGDPRPAQKRAVAKLERYIVSPRVSKHRLFAWRMAKLVPDSAIVAIARDDDTTFGILHSIFHELWALRMGTYLGVGNDPRYTPSSTFETFPFPAGLTPNISAADYATEPRAVSIANAARRLNDLRENWLNPADLVDRVPEVVPGYPDRVLAKDEKAANELKKRTLTNLYNTRPAWLEHAHKTMDEAVAEAYGWGDDWRSGALTDDEVLARLFKLNQERSTAEAVAEGPKNAK